MSERLIQDQTEFDELCEHIREAGIVAFDTEFVSEGSYRPRLCLLQFATPEQCAAVDPLAVDDLSAWWDIMTDDATIVVVHSGREEVRFCMTNTGKSARRIVDIQIAEGLRSRSFPMSYSSIVSRVLGNRAHGKETRTDWARRPLTKKQLDYALEDVKYVLEIWDRQLATLEKLGRVDWAEAEFQRMVDEIAAERSDDRWRRLSGIQRLRPRELAVAREIYQWRDAEAESRNQPVRRILRDDLLIDLARRQPANAEEVLATRDMNRPAYKRAAGELAECVRVALAIPDSELPKKELRQDNGDDEHVLAKLLGIALANRCAELEVSSGLVGTSADLKELVRWHFSRTPQAEPPRISQGWRAEVCGDLLNDVLDGKVSLRVADPQSDHPLVFEREDDKPSSSSGSARK